MKAKSFKRVLALVLATAMVLTACGQKPAANTSESTKTSESTAAKEESKAEEKEEVPPVPVIHDLHVIGNGYPLTLRGKASYVYVDVFDYIEFDLSKPKGSMVITKLNGGPAEYLKEIHDGDVIEVYWKN